MSQVLVTEDYLEDIADAIREKNESESTYTPAQMAPAIEAIRTADEVVIASKSIMANGTYNASSDDADGYDPVTVNVPNSYTASDEGKVVSSGELVAQTSKNISSNGTYDTTENNEVVVAVPTSGEPTLVSKTITQNGTYYPADDNADGYSQITVSVPSGGGSLVKLMEQGQVSTTSAYATAYFDSDIDFLDYNAIRFDLYRGGVKVGSNVLGDATFRENNSEMLFYITGGTYTYTMRFHRVNKTIRCSSYSGSYVNLYVDAYGANI